MREELITITRMLLGLPPAVMGDLPAPEPSEATVPEAAPDMPSAETPAKE